MSMTPHQNSLRFCQNHRHVRPPLGAGSAAWAAAARPGLQEAIDTLREGDLQQRGSLASVLLPRMTNLGTSLDLLLAGKIMDAPRLERLRLVSRVVPSGRALSQAIGVAKDMAQRFGSATAFRKEQIWQFTGLPLPTALNLARTAASGV